MTHEAQHQLAAHTFTEALLRILQRTEVLLQRRVEADAKRRELLPVAEVQDSNWGAWVDAGGDLLMGQGAPRN